MHIISLARSRGTRLLSLIIFLATLPHCARYQPTALLRPLSRLEKSGVEVGVKELTRAEFRRYFDSNLASKTFVALQLFIKNKTSLTYVLDPDNISLPLEHARTVARQLYRNTVLRVMVWAVPGQLFWPCNIPAIVDGLHSYEANKAIDEDVKDRSFGSGYIEIKPRTSFNRVIFVDRKNYKAELAIRLEDFDGKVPLEYHFDLTQKTA